MFKLFQALSLFDWITPLWGMAQDIKNDPTPLQTNSWTFFIPYRDSVRTGWNANQIRDLLHRQGIKTWGYQITNGQLFFGVSLKNAQDAEFHLNRHGVPIDPKFAGAPAPKMKEMVSERQLASMTIRQTTPAWLRWLRDR
jgi:hypothetical protein